MMDTWLNLWLGFYHEKKRNEWILWPWKEKKKHLRFKLKMWTKWKRQAPKEARHRQEVKSRHDEKWLQLTITGQSRSITETLSSLLVLVKRISVRIAPGVLQYKSIWLMPWRGVSESISVDYSYLKTRSHQGFSSQQSDWRWKVRQRRLIIQQLVCLIRWE